MLQIIQETRSLVQVQCTWTFNVLERSSTLNVQVHWTFKYIERSSTLNVHVHSIFVNHYGGMVIFIDRGYTGLHAIVLFCTVCAQWLCTVTGNSRPRYGRNAIRAVWIIINQSIDIRHYTTWRPKQSTKCNAWEVQRTKCNSRSATLGYAS